MVVKAVALNLVMMMHLYHYFNCMSPLVATKVKYGSWVTNHHFVPLSNINDWFVLFFVTWAVHEGIICFANKPRN